MILPALIVSTLVKQVAQNLKKLDQIWCALIGKQYYKILYSILFHYLSSFQNKASGIMKNKKKNFLVITARKATTNPRKIRVQLFIIDIQ
jgi:hypothetical protein